jgi:hypothetical protein
LTLPINDWIDHSNDFKLSLVRFPNDISLDLVDKISVRTGLMYKSHILDSKTNVSEVGGSLGFGFKFKAVGNQVDLNYYLGNRKYSDIFYKTEIIQQMQVGVSLGDLWFVKRRQK